MKYDAKKNTLELDDGEKLVNIHAPGTCWGEFCTIHKPSLHKYLDLPLTWVNDMLCRYDCEIGYFPDPDNLGFQRDQTVIMVNAAVCLMCDEYIESWYRHDFKFCMCKNVFVDGGKDYLRHGYNDKTKYRDESISFTKEELGL